MCALQVRHYATASNSPASALQDCSGVIHISVFSTVRAITRNIDEQTKSWSNVARLWQSARMFANGNANVNTYPIYISGVGTLQRQGAFSRRCNRYSHRRQPSRRGPQGRAGRAASTMANNRSTMLCVVCCSEMPRPSAGRSPYAAAGQQQALVS